MIIKIRAASSWKTHRGDQWWYADKIFTAEGSFSLAYPAHLEIVLTKIDNNFTEIRLHQFLFETQKEFKDCELWVVLNSKIKQMITSLKALKKIDWRIIKNPLSESARITYISLIE